MAKKYEAAAAKVDKEKLYAPLEVGTDNDYGHPSKKALSALEKNGVMIYRTDLNGSIIATCDGKTIEWKTEKGEV